MFHSDDDIPDLEDVDIDEIEQETEEIKPVETKKVTRH